MAVFTGVGREIDVGADPDPAACAAYALVVLASADHQHRGERFAGEVLRVPISDVDKDGEPTMDEVRRAQAAAERVAFVAAPFSVPYDVYKRFVPPPGRVGGKLLPELKPEKVLVACEEGMNRSAWIAAMALVLTGEQPSGAAAFEHVKQLRGPRAFHNKHVAKALRAYMPESLKAMRGPVAKDVVGGGIEGTAPGGVRLR